MTISIWRYSHFALALASSLFLIIASITGVILAVEPISHQAKGYAVQDLDKITLGTTLNALQENYEEVFSLEVESSGFVKASVLTAELETLELYIDPSSGEKLGEVEERPYIYSFATNLHRSLFLKSTGRVFVGLISLLLLFIAITGILLLAKRQGGFKRLLSKVQKDYFELRYHVLLSRWFFIPIVILAFTGVYLSAEKFELLPAAPIVHKEIEPSTANRNYKNIREIPFFKETTLDEVREVEFPFSDDPEEYYQIALKEKEVRVNQQSGEILSSVEYPFVQLASRLSWELHTGEGNVLWSVILLLSSASILFFMYSGFVMTLRRRKKVKSTSVIPDKDECEIVLLVGSETGTSYDFAKRLYNGLSFVGKKVHLTELNSYSTYAKAKYIIVLSATYGEGEPPTNARKFEALFPAIVQPNPINYAVVGFGSLEYPDYCKFAIQVEELLQARQDFKSLLPLYKINNADFADFENWVRHMGEKLGVSISIEKPKLKKPKYKKVRFEVVERTDLNVDDTFLIRLKPKRKIKFTSGDLLNVFPEGTDIPRQYSIAKMGSEILLSVKKHEFGKGSSYLFNLKENDFIKAAVESNAHFHFPKKTTSAVMIANGTGIAPYLGMIEQNRQANINLFWGGKTKTSSLMYEAVLNGHLSQNDKVIIHKSYSRERNKQYVQELVSEHTDIVLNTIQEGGAIMICGSLEMQHDVLNSLEKMLAEKSQIGLDELQHKGQLKMDCY